MHPWRGFIHSTTLSAYEVIIYAFARAFVMFSIFLRTYYFCTYIDLYLPTYLPTISAYLTVTANEKKINRRIPLLS